MRDRTRFAFVREVELISDNGRASEGTSST